jgi:hypothetical protein
LRSYLESEENSQKYLTLKNMRQSIIDARKGAKQWVDKPFYIGLKLGDLNEDAQSVKIVLGECVFKQST